MNNTASRLSALRKEMANFNIDGFIVPRADEHQGEYVAPCSERLAWISGFTGSAGQAIVLKESACIVVDGRYTIQAENEVDGEQFDYRHYMHSPSEDWLKENLSEGMKLAYDPWLHTGPSLHRLKKACEKVGAQLVGAPHNFIDAIWADRPAAPLAPVVPHDLKYAGTPHGGKLSAMADELKDQDQDAMVQTLPDSIAWTLNIRGGDIPCTPVALGFSLIHSDGSADLFMDGRKISKETHEHLGDKVRVHEPKEFAKVLMQLSNKTVRFDGTSASVWIHDQLKQAGATVVLDDDLSILLRACKNQTEINGMFEAHKRDGGAMVRFLHWLSKQPYGPELNELSVSDKIDSLRSKDDLFFDYSFETISGAGENGAIVHYRVSPESSIELPENGLYLVDSGGQYKDGTTDITRTIARGLPTAEMKDRFTRVLKGHIAISSTRFPAGATGSQIDVLARHALWQVGLDYDHGTGHGVGSFLNVHEGPQRISMKPSSVPLRPGMVISNEPGYYKNGEYGIRLENLICVFESEKGERDMLEFVPLTLCPFDLNVIEPALLNEDEINWLNAYHAHVLKELSPLLSSEDVDWLVEVTKAL